MAKRVNVLRDKIARNAREQIDAKTGKEIVTSANNKNLSS